MNKYRGKTHIFKIQYSNTIPTHYTLTLGLWIIKLSLSIYFIMLNNKGETNS